MKQGSIAKRYARALIKIAEEKGKVAEFYEQLKTLGDELASHSELQTILSTPLVKPSKKKSIFKLLEGKLSLSTEVSNLINFIIDHERMGILPMLVLLYRDMADELLGQVRVEVKSASALGEQEQKLKAVLEKKLGRKVLIHTQIQPELLGGLVLKIEDKVLDASLKRELERFKEEIIRKAVA